MRLKFWVKNGLLLSCILAMAAPFFILLMALQNPDYTLEQAYINGTSYLWMFTGIMGLTLGANLYVQYLNLALGFGSTRKEACWGMLCYRSISPVITTVMYLLFYLLLGRNNPMTPTMILPVCLGLSLILGAAGSLLGMLWSKWGKRAYWVLIPASIVGTLSFTGLMIAMTLSQYQVHVGWLWNTAGWIVLAVGIAAHFLCMIPEHKTIYRFNVKL